MKRRTIVLGILTTLGTALMFFENCSKASFNSSGADLESFALNTPLQVGESQQKISAQQVPNLKLFFVVDNSYTMTKNQLNLGQSFAQMFSDDEANSLKRFDTTAFLISTAQKAEGLGSPQLKSVLDVQLGADVLGAFGLADLNRYRQSAVKVGPVPGDGVGFSAALGNGGRSVAFLPAVVSGADGAGQVGTGIHKAMGESSDALAAEFQRRLAVFSPDRQPANADGSFVFSDMLDNESGLCATARLLRNSDAYVKSGEQAAFVIVSDEDENDPAGKSCAQSFTQIQSTDDLIKGTCETRSSTLTYTVPGRGADACTVKYQSGYQVKYQYPTTVASTAITYRQQTSPGAYASPQTNISFSTRSPVYTQTLTNVAYQVKVCTTIFHDGVAAGQNCVFNPKSGSVNGNKANQCAAAASSLDGQAVTNDPAHAPTCAVATKSVTSCAANDSSCVTTYTFNSATQLVDGTFAPGDACVNRAKSISGAIVDGSRPVGCAAAAPKTGSGACPSNLAALGCQPSSGPQFATRTVTLAGDFTSASACAQKAAQQSGAAIDASNPPACVKTNVTNTTTFGGTIAFKDSGDNGSTQATGACGSIAPAVIAAAQRANPNAPGDGTCQITNVATASGSAGASNGACDAASVSQVCDSSDGAKRKCAGTFVAGNATSTPTTLPAVSRDLNCADLCAATDNTLCTPNTGVAVTDGMTIAQYLVARFGAGTTCAMAKTASPVSNFVDRLASDRASLCKGTASLPQYIVSSGTYHASPRVVTDWVAGNLADGSAPASSLGDFLTTRSRSLFTISQPLVSVLVRMPNDPLGEGGTRGAEYSRVAAAMGGRADSVLSTDYSQSLHALSGIIQDRLQRSFVVGEMKPTQVIQQVSMLKAGTKEWFTLSPADWTANGNVVTINKNVAYSPDDYLRFRYF